MTPQKLRIANSLWEDIELCKQTISFCEIKLSGLSSKNEDNKAVIRFYKTKIAIEQDKQVKLESEFKNL